MPKQQHSSSGGRLRGSAATKGATWHATRELKSKTRAASRRGIDRVFQPINTIAQMQLENPDKTSSQKRYRPIRLVRTHIHPSLPIGFAPDHSLDGEFDLDQILRRFGFVCQG